MTVQEKVRDIPVAKCPFEHTRKHPQELPDDITACLRPATAEESEQHYRELSERGIIQVMAEGAKDMYDRVNNTARVVLDLDFRANMERTVHRDPYLALHKIIGRDLHLTSHPRVMEAILKHYHHDDSEEGCFQITDKISKTVELLQDLFNDPEIQNEDLIVHASKEAVKKYRKFLLQYFGSGQVKKMIPYIGELCSETIERWKSSSDPTINITKESKVFASSVMTKLFLGYSGPYDDLCKAVDDVLIYLISLLLNKSPSDEFMEQLEIDKEVLRTRVEEAMSRVSDDSEEMSLVEAMKETGEFTDQQIKVMTFSLFFAGQDNTASLMNYSVLKCAQNKELQEQIKHEISSLVEENEYSVAEAAVQSPTIKQVIVESLRMVTPIYSIGRVTDKDLILEVTQNESGEVTQYFIEKGHRVNPSPTFAARHEYLADPEDANVFDHNRFAAEAIPNFLPNLSWSPFGRGPHTCPAWSLAYHEVMILLGTLVHENNLDTDVIGEPRLIGKFSCTTAEDVHVAIS